MLKATWKQLYSRFTVYEHLCQKLKKLNETVCCIKMSNYTKKFILHWKHLCLLQEYIQTSSGANFLESCDHICPPGEALAQVIQNSVPNTSNLTKVYTLLFSLTILRFGEKEIKWFKESIGKSQDTSFSLTPRNTVNRQQWLDASKTI